MSDVLKWLLEGGEKERRWVGGEAVWGKLRLSGWVETAKYICESGSRGNRGGTVQLLSRGSDALAVVANERSGACPGAVHQ